MNKSNRGITLIALVITIIVLLILAGISISLIIGDNGIIQRAQEAKEKYGQSEINEHEEFNKLENRMEEITGEEKFDSETIEEDVIKNLLKCINHNNLSMPLEDVVQDETLLTRIMSSEIAVNYMIRSKKIIMPGIINSALAVKTIGLSEYAMNAVINNNDWKTAILNNSNAIAGLDQSNPITVPKMTSDTTPKGRTSAKNIYRNAAYFGFGDNYTGSYGQYGCISAANQKNDWWIQYEFEEEVWIYKCDFTFTAGQGYNTTNVAIVEVSKDGNNWISATDNISATFNNAIGPNKSVILSKNSHNKAKYLRIRMVSSLDCDTCGVRQVQIYSK